MSFEYLAAQYREGGRLCRTRARALRRILNNAELQEPDALELKKRISVLDSMARDASNTASYLETYYERRSSIEYPTRNRNSSHKTSRRRPPSGIILQGEDSRSFIV